MRGAAAGARRAARTLALLVAVGGVGCGERTEAPPAPPSEPPPADAFEARARAVGRERAPYMDRLADPTRGELTEGEAHDTSAVLRPGWCYKIVAVGGEGIDDIGLRAYRPDGSLVERDITEEPVTVLGVERPICPVQVGQYRIEVRAERGAGPYLVQLYRSI
ncbi:MAG: hypothetical protein ACFCGT_23250 [Sandaracinaceae bacterium]